MSEVELTDVERLRECRACGNYFDPEITGTIDFCSEKCKKSNKKIINCNMCNVQIQIDASIPSDELIFCSSQCEDDYANVSNGLRGEL